MEAEAANEQRATVEAQADTMRDAPEGTPLARRALVVTCVVAAVALVLSLVWYAADLLLLVFAGVLVSVLLRGLSRALRNRLTDARVAKVRGVMRPVSNGKIIESPGRRKVEL